MESLAGCVPLLASAARKEAHSMQGPVVVDGGKFPNSLPAALRRPHKSTLAFVIDAFSRDPLQIKRPCGALVPARPSLRLSAVFVDPVKDMGNGLGGAAKETAATLFALLTRTPFPRGSDRRGSLRPIQPAALSPSTVPYPPQDCPSSVCRIEQVGVPPGIPGRLKSICRGGTTRTHWNAQQQSTLGVPRESLAVDSEENFRAFVMADPLEDPRSGGSRERGRHASRPSRRGGRAVAPLFNFLQSFLPDTRHPAASQATPYGVNRYVLLLVYLFLVVLMGSDYLGWGPLSSMLYRSRAFYWLCSEDEILSATSQSSPGKPICIPQRQAIQTLFSGSYATYFIANALAGFLVDFAGPKVTALLGATLSACGWLMLGASCETFRVLLPSFLMIGGGAGMIYLPLLCIVNLFPGSFGIVLTLMGASLSLSLSVPSLLNSMHRSGVSLSFVCWMYAVVGPLMGILVISLFVPLEGFIDVDLFVLSLRSEYPAGCKTSGDQRCPAVALSTVTDDDYFKPFRVEAWSFVYFAVCGYFTLCSLSMLYYQKAAPVILTEPGQMALEIASPLSTIPCIILGRVTDYIPIVYVMMFVNFTGAVSFLLAAYPIGDASIISVCFFSVYIAIFTSQVFIYIKSLFTSIHFGKLAGIACMLGGIISVSIERVYCQLTEKHFKGNYSPSLWAHFGILVCAYFLLIPMARAASRRQKEMSSQRELVTQPTTRAIPDYAS
ncbi:major facilitator family domain-containing protein [Cyclospora cayetanensis]|uniref:Major facilitator family domain-containing protein n=1 Tax=Cyclospora cayetanensis TaxID=88456 RepID=A0A1D3CUI6_9EIME|nr:major facilitator family domain-containing protein [Cyclospora cayetanensis]